MPKSLRSQRDMALRGLLRQARLDAGLTQSDLAARLDRPQSYVAKIENSERRIDVAEFLDIAQALDCDACAILRTVQRLHAT